jgi:hypothetical protein
MKRYNYLPKNHVQKQFDCTNLINDYSIFFFPSSYKKKKKKKKKKKEDIYGQSVCFTTKVFFFFKKKKNKFNVAFQLTENHLKKKKKCKCGSRDAFAVQINRKS